MASHKCSLIENYFTVSVNDATKATCNQCKVVVSRDGKNPSYLELNAYLNICKHRSIEHGKVRIWASVCTLLYRSTWMLTVH